MATDATPRRQTASSMVAEHLRRQILSGQLAPGARLLIPDIAQRMGVSQTPTRAALQQLEAEGLVSFNAYRGSRVAELDVNECEEIYVMRSALERLAARLGTLAIDDEGLADMERLLGLMREAAQSNDIDAFLEADREFHRVHFTASGRERLWGRIIALRYASERYTRLTYETVPHEMTNGIGRHAELLDHIRARDLDAVDRWVAGTMDRVMHDVGALLEPAAASDRGDRARADG
jgi:DNA-binding GntR family transcriptional regulator